MTTINDIRQHFITELASKNFTEDRSGGMLKLHGMNYNQLILMIST